jgi:UDP-glucose 4-epimerase
VPEVVPIPENHHQSPVNPYGNTKLIMEMMMRDYAAAGHLSFVALRYFNAAGAAPDAETGEKHDPETHLIPLVLDAACGRRSEVTVFGDDYPTHDGTCIRDYIHVSDLADAHVRALSYLEKNTGSHVFNLGNGQGFSVLEIIAATEKVLGRKVPYKLGSRRPGDPAILVGNPELACDKLGWKPEFKKIEDIILHAWNFHKKAWGIE